MKKKYCLTDETITGDGHTLYRIKALRNFSDIKAGDLGGYIEKEENLSHKGNCWVYDKSFVFDNAQVLENAKVRDKCIVYGNAIVRGNASVYENATINDNAILYKKCKVHGNSCITENAKIYSNSEVCGYSCVAGNARIYNNSLIDGESQIFGNARVCYSTIIGSSYVFENVKVKCSKITGSSTVRGSSFIADSNINNSIIDDNVEIHDTEISNISLCKDARINSKFDIITVSGFGPEAKNITFFKCKDGYVKVIHGCFIGTLNEFINKVQYVYGYNKYGLEYAYIIKAVKEHFNLI